MRVSNIAYDQKFAISKTIVLAYREQSAQLNLYLTSFNKKIDAYIGSEEKLLEFLAENTVFELPLSSIFIKLNTAFDTDILKKAGYQEIYLFQNGRLIEEKNVSISLKENPFKNVHRVTFELSNMCGYSYKHEKCPLSIEKSKKILPADIFYSSIDCLNKYNYTGGISFHRYNEPLMDPRLIDFVKYAREKCPYSDIFILTNGFYLNQELLDELVSAGVTHINVTGYSREEFNRLANLKASIPYKVFESIFDDRLKLYDWEKIKKEKIPCYQPLSDLIITRDAELGLCHFDWKCKYSFGNLKEQALDEILLNSDIGKIYEDLTLGIRHFELCKHCTYATHTDELSFFYSNIYFKPEEN